MEDTERHNKQECGFEAADCARGFAPVRLCNLFVRARSPHSHFTRGSIRHTLQLVDPIDGTQSALVERSVLGLVRYWNALPDDLVYSKNVNIFQSDLQQYAKHACASGMYLDADTNLNFIMTHH